LVDALIIIACILGALLFLFIVSRTYAAHARKESNDFTGAVVAVIGTTYAVILAFMLSGVWNQYQQAQSNEEQEANALVNVWRIATQLQVPGAQEAEALCLTYADNAIHKEWPALLASKPLPPGNADVINELWKFAGQIQAHSGNDSIAAYQMMEELRMLTEYRRIRIMQSREALPVILWAVLIAGGTITIASACFFGVPSFRFHVLQVAVLTFLISLVLVAIADIDQPYQGGLTVKPEGFSFTRETVGGPGR
jgi:ABC-type branched-subunit amino acid transport system permease subunit